MATRLLPDTNVMIMAMAGIEPASSVIGNAILKKRLVLSSIVIAEFLVKAEPEDEQKMLFLASEVPVIPVDLTVARLAARYRKEALKNKKKELLPDCLIAAQSKVVRAEIITFDKKDYTIPEISLYQF